MKLYTATLIHETNSFSPIPTDLESYRETFLYLPSTGEGVELADSLVADVNLSLMAEQRGHWAHQGLIAGAQPSMPTSLGAWEALRDEVISDIERMESLDAVLLFLHGAQMAMGVDDCEGELLEAIRERVGSDVVIAVLFDLHGNVTERMVAATDFLVACQEYPHIDFEARAEHMFDLVEKAVAGELSPQVCCQRIPMFGSFPTTRQPMRDFVDRCLGLQGCEEVLSVSLAHGFAWSDVADAGASVMVTTNGDMQRAAYWSRQLALEFFAIRDALVSPPLSVDSALDKALEQDAYPVVIADTTDNPGGGAPGDSTYLLRCILQRGITDVGLAMIFDPEATKIAAAAGEGAVLSLRIGGKLCALSGTPLDVEAKVLCVRKDAVQLRSSSCRPLGLAVAIAVAGVEIVMCSVREQTFTRECFTEMGIDPSSKRLLVVKSHQHFHEDFSKFASEILYATPPGVVVRDFSGLPYRNITRPVWPIDSPPFFAHDINWT